VAGKTNGDGDGDLPYLGDWDIGCYENLLVGDAYYMDWGSAGGKDTLVSSTGDDVMAGDGVYVEMCEGGADRFVFAPGNGHDYILDFDASEGDRIDLYALRANPQLRSVAAMNAAGRIEDTGDDVVIQLDTLSSGYTNTITVMGVEPGDLAFIFTL
jgi:hypothetical protein